MGRQTIWGGAGKPPSRDVMQAAAKAARQEMMERIRTNKAAQGQGERSPRQGNGGGGRSEMAAAHAAKARTQVEAALARVVAQVAATLNRHPHAAGPRPDNSSRYDDAQPPRANAHLGTHLGHSNPVHRNGGHGAGGQPDPMRTSVDSMAERGSPRRWRLP
jgi:ATP-dependent RNA helicase RhlE